MKKIFSKLGVVGLLSLMLLSFTQTGISNEVFDITKETVLVAEQDVLVVEEAVEEAPTLNSGDTAWMIVATILVIVMAIPGLALFYGGLVRSKNMLSVLMQVFATFSFNVSFMGHLWLQCRIFRWGRNTMGSNDRRGFWCSIFKWHYTRFSIRYNS